MKHLTREDWLFSSFDITFQKIIGQSSMLYIKLYLHPGCFGEQTSYFSLNKHVRAYILSVRWSIHIQIHAYNIVENSKTFTQRFS